jgi:hypothetical protein
MCRLWLRSFGSDLIEKQRRLRQFYRALAVRPTAVSQPVLKVSAWLAPKSPATRQWKEAWEAES